jgi:hypothetical protein
LKILGGVMISSSKSIRLFAVGVLALVMIACAQQQTSSGQATKVQATPFSVVATGDSNFNGSQAQTFSWSSGMQEITGVPRLHDVPLKDMLKDSISDNLNAKGYRYQEEQGPGDLVVGYSVSLDDSEMNSDAARRSGVIPSLNYSTPDPEKYEKGTIVIEVTQSATGIVAWRSALQGFSIIDLDDADRRKRLDGMVQRMLSGLPAKSN